VHAIIACDKLHM